MVDPAVELEATKTALQALQQLDQEQAGRALRWLGEILGVSGQVALAAMTPLPPSAPAPMMSAPPYQAAPGPYAPTIGSEALRASGIRKCPGRGLPLWMPETDLFRISEALSSGAGSHKARLYVSGFRLIDRVADSALTRRHDYLHCT
jgi:hypothetical protein